MEKAPHPLEKSVNTQDPDFTSVFLVTCHKIKIKME